MSKTQKHHPEGKTYDVLSIDERKTVLLQNTRKKRYIQRNIKRKKEKKKRKTVIRELRVAVGAHAYRRTIERTKPRLQSKQKDEKRNKNRTNVTPEKYDMTSANQTPGGYKFASLVGNQLWRANQHEPACFKLSSPWYFPS